MPDYTLAHPAGMNPECLMVRVDLGDGTRASIGELVASGRVRLCEFCQTYVEMGAIHDNCHRPSLRPRGQRMEQEPTDA